MAHYTHEVVLEVLKAHAADIANMVQNWPFQSNSLSYKEDFDSSDPDIRSRCWTYLLVAAEFLQKLSEMDQRIVIKSINQQVYDAHPCNKEPFKTTLNSRTYRMLKKVAILHQLAFSTKLHSSPMNITRVVATWGSYIPIPKPAWFVNNFGDSRSDDDICHKVLSFLKNTEIKDVVLKVEMNP